MPSVDREMHDMNPTREEAWSLLCENDHGSSGIAYLHLRRCKGLHRTALSCTEHGPTALDGPYTQSS